MHESVMHFVARMVEEHRLNRHAWRVLECGSLDVNGSVRALFDRTSYHGIDIQAGAGVEVDTKRDPQHPGVFAIAKCDRAKG